MSDKTTNKTEQPSPLCEAKEMSSLPSGAHLVSNTSSKAPLSVLSPHVPEFVPRSCASRKGITLSQATSAKDWVDGPSQEGRATDKIGTSKDLPRKVEESDESNSRGWWEETPLTNKVNDKTTMNPSKADFISRGLPKKTPKLQNENTLTCSWRQKINNEEMNLNWRTCPTDQNQRTKNNELGFTRDKRKPWRKDPSQSNAPQNKERSSVQAPVEVDNKLTGIEHKSCQEVRQQRGSEVKDGQLQQRSIRIGSGRGRGRIRTAWMNGLQNQDSSLHNNEPKHFEKTSQENNALSTKSLGHGHGVQSGSHSHVGCAANKQTLNTVDDLTRKKDCGSDISKRNDEEDYRSLVVEDEGWIVVGNKKKMDEHKDWASKTKDKRNNSNEKRLNKELKEVHQRDEKASLLDSHQKVVKKNRKKDEKDRTMDRTVQEQKVLQNKEVNLDQSIFSKDLRKQNIKPKRMKKATPEGERNCSVESETKSSKNGQEKESKKVEVVKTIKTGQNSRQKEVKILLKKSNDNTKVSQNEQTIIRDPEFELCNDDDEFPDLAAASKSSNTSLASDWLSGGSRMPIISYSAVLKALPRPKAQPSRNIPSDKSSSEIQEKIENEGGEEQGKKKKKKKKKKAKESEVNAKQTPQEHKKTKQPMQFDLGDWLSTIEKIPPKIGKDKQANPKKVVTIATGVLQIKVKDQPVTTARTATVKSAHGLPHNEKTFHNILDSTAPVVKRGKEREVPKKKKPSQLKRIILREREEKKKAVQGEEKQDVKTEHESLSDEIDSSQEIRDPNKTDQKSSKGDSDVTQSTDDVTSHHDGSTNVTSDDPSSDGDRPVAPSQDDVKAQIHSRRFREYCDNVMDKELNNTTLELLQKLVMFQDRQYHKDPVKSKAKRRYVVGLREVTKHLKLKKIKLVIISPNVERIKSAGGLDDTLHNIISIAHQNGVPVVFALRRQVLGRVLHKKVPVSAIGVFYYDGAQDEYMKLMDLTEKAREVYAQRWKSAYDQLMERIQKERAVEMSHDTQEESGKQITETSQDKDGEKTENPNENEKKKEANEDPEDDKDNLGELDNTTQGEGERKSKEFEQEENGNQKDEIFDPSESSPEESENECDIDSFHSEKIEWNETNEIENECSNGDNPSVVQETDLAVEDL